MLKRRAQYVFFSLAILLLVFYGCENNSDSNQYDSEETKRAKADSLRRLQKKEIAAFYDKIGYQIINLILEDRVYVSNAEQKPNLEKLPLDSFSLRIDTSSESGKNVNLYTKRLIEFKKNAVELYNKDSIVEVFERYTDSFLRSEFFNNTLIGVDSKTKESRITIPEYASLKEGIDVRLLRTKEALGNNKKALEKITTEKDNSHQNGETSEESLLSRLYLLWFILFIVSLLGNIFQFIRSRKKSEAKEKEDVQPEPISVKAIPYDNEGGEPLNPEMPKVELSPSERDRISKEKLHKTFEVIFKDHHTDCVESIADDVNHVTQEITEDVESKSFDDEEDLIQYIDSIFRRNKENIEEKLADCIAKEEVVKRINAIIILQNFTDEINTELVSKEDIQTKINQFKQTLFESLDKVQSRGQIQSQIENLNKDIMMDLQKMAKENLVYYFPFANASGAIDEHKKTKIIERDSAIELSIDPNDTSKATFRLLYQKSDMMQAGIMSYDSLLLPICELKKEDFNSMGTTIAQIGEDGSMELKDGFWKVKTKLSIKVV